MKVFIPVNDSLLNSGTPEIEKLVPFSSDFLTESCHKRFGSPKEESVKPKNWIAESDYASACKRLKGDLRLVTV